MSRGIDYGRGMTNIDTKTGIRYGILPQGAILQAWADSSEPPDVPPSCPKCGNDVAEYDDDAHAAYEEDGHYSACPEYACTHCELKLSNDYVWPECEDGAGYYVKDDEITAEIDGHGDIWIFKSIYYTRAQFCSPCAPGACHLESPCEDGERAYCFGPDWFSGDAPCPYPVYRVSDDTCIYTPKTGEEA